MNKVIEITDNIIFDKNKSIGTLALNYANPIVSIPFVNSIDPKFNIENLCKKSNLSKDKDRFYFNGQLVTGDMKIDAIVSDLCSIAEVVLTNESDDLYLGNMIKYILKNEVLKRYEEKKSLLTEADLIKNLYGIEEDFGGKSLW